MAQQGKQMRVGAHKDSAYHPAKLVLWLTVTGMRSIPIRLCNSKAIFLDGSSVLPYMTRPPPGLGTPLGQVTVFRG
jgi:hypothetical protein